MILAIFFGMYIYGHEVLELYMPLEEKATAEMEKEIAEEKKKMDELLSDFDKDKHLAEFRKVEETQDKSTSSTGDPNLMV